MNPTKTMLIGLPVLLAAVSLVAVGCGSTPKPKPVYGWDISITKKTPASIEVDIVGITSTEKAFCESLTADQYWKPGSRIRTDLHPLSQTLQLNQPWEITRGDPKWLEWKGRGVTEVLVLANLPGTGGRWKEYLPLDKKAWDPKKKYALEVEILETRIQVLTPRKGGS